MKTVSKEINNIKLIYYETGEIAYCLPEDMNKEKYALWKKENKEEIERTKNNMKKKIRV